MNILLTNDDGYNAPGLLALKEILKQYGTVYTIAPDSVKSGCGASLSTFHPVKINKIDKYNYIVYGTPVDCVQFATILIKKKIDLIVSGLNWGYNLSLDTMYSGTCSAGFQSLIFNKKAIVFSTEKFKEPTAISKYGKEVLDYIFNNKLLSKQYYLNVNFPDIEKYPKYKGIKITKLFIRHSDYSYEILDKKEQIYQLYHHHHDIQSDDTFDVSATANGYISITPMSIINYQEKDYKKLVKKIKL